MVHDYRALLPAPARPIARFRVGVGEQTGLTEPYRHLSEAYTHLEGAYAQTLDAYGQTKVAYDRTRGELDHLRGVWERWLRELEELQLKKRWWRMPQAVRLLRDLPKRIRTSEGDSGRE